MTLRSRVLDTLHNGVSQQPPLLRAPDQTEREENTWATLSDGVGRRPPTESIANLGNLSADAFIHHINRDVNERYIVVIDGGQIKVFDHETGVQKTVNAPDGLDYVASGTFRAVTIADYTFIVNTEKRVDMLAATDRADPDPPYYRWPNRSPARAAVEGLLGYTGNASGGEYQYQARNPAGSYKGELASAEKLPETATNGDMYKITGSVESGFVSYYVRRSGSVWDETRANGLRNDLDATTMPHCLVSEEGGTFTFAPFSWAARTVGDEHSNPPPTFVDREIRDVFFYQNRLGFLVDENVVFSCAGDFGNFWRNTVLDYVASDVVDVAVTTANVALLNYAVVSADGIMAFADQTQFSITNGEDGLSPESVAIRPVTHYEVNTKARPIQMGTEIYFCGDQSDSSIVWEYTRQDDVDALSAAEITAHVPRYIPSGIQHMIAATNAKALFAITGGQEVFVYQFYWNGNEKLQSAWRKWTFSGDVLSGAFLDGHLFLLIRRGVDVWLEKVNLEAYDTPAEQNHQVFLDRRVSATGTYDLVADRTYFDLPYVYSQSDIRLVRGKDHATRPGSLIDPSTYTFVTPTRIAVAGKEADIEVTVGEKFNTVFQFSRQFPVDYQGRPLTTGRLQLRTFTVYFTGTAFFRTEVSPYGIPEGSQTEDIVPAKLADFTGKVIGSSELTLNSPSYQTGSYSFQVYGDAEQATVTLSNDTHVASTFVSAEWEGFFYKRA